MQDNILIPLLLIAAGAVSLALGFAGRARARAAEGVPCRHISELVPGERQFLSGKARALAPLQAPLSKQACAFYLETIERRRQGSRGGSYWERVADNYYGAFWVDDPTGAALVLPAYPVLDLALPGQTMDDFSAERRSEQLIAEGGTVTAMGTPRSLAEFIQYLRQTPRANISPEGLAALLALQKEPAGAGVPCFFGQGLERVADRTYAAYVAAGGGSASLLLKAGAALLAAGLAALVYALGFSGGGAPSPE